MSLVWGWFAKAQEVPEPKGITCPKCGGGRLQFTEQPDGSVQALCRACGHTWTLED